MLFISKSYNNENVLPETGCTQEETPRSNFILRSSRRSFTAEFTWINVQSLEICISASIAFVFCFCFSSANRKNILKTCLVVERLEWKRNLMFRSWIRRRRCFASASECLAYLFRINSHATALASGKRIWKCSISPRSCLSIERRWFWISSFIPRFT